MRLTVFLFAFAALALSWAAGTNPGASSVISDRTLYLKADRKTLAMEGDPEAAFLLVGKGGELPDAEARKHGLLPGPESPAGDGLVDELRRHLAALATENTKLEAEVAALKAAAAAPRSEATTPPEPTPPPEAEAKHLAGPPETKVIAAPKRTK